MATMLRKKKRTKENPVRLPKRTKTNNTLSFFIVSDIPTQEEKRTNNLVSPFPRLRVTDITRTAGNTGTLIYWENRSGPIKLSVDRKPVTQLQKAIQYLYEIECECDPEEYLLAVDQSLNKRSPSLMFSMTNLFDHTSFLFVIDDDVQDYLGCEAHHTRYALLVQTFDNWVDYVDEFLSI